jgi:erythrocyte band 7 integral membrane protein
MRFKDIHLSETVLNSLSATAIAEANAKAKIVLAKADVESAEYMRKAADAINTPSAMQIRYLETIQKLSSSANAKIVFLPTNYNENGGSTALTNQVVAMASMQE